jgi:hypothetical protein
MPDRPPLHLLALLLIVSLAPVPGAGARSVGRAPEPLPKLDAYDVPAFLRGLERSRAPGARLLRRQIRNGPRDLARQRAAARREGVSLSPMGLRQPPLPAGQNAAPVYRRLVRLLKEKPLDQEVERLARDLGVRTAHKPEEIDRVRKLLAQRQDVIALIHAATDRPRCDFGWDWSQSPDVIFVSEYSAMRKAVILLSAQSYFLAKGGHYEQAIQQQIRGFRVAEHVAADRIVLSFIIAAAYARMTLDGVENILHLAGAEAEVTDSLSAAITAHWPQLSLTDALKGEAASTVISLDRLRRAGPSLLARWQRLLEFDANLRARRSKHAVRPLSARSRRTWLLMLDAAEALYVRQMRQVIAGAARPHSARHALYNQLDYLDDRPSVTERLFGGITGLSFTRLGWNQLRTKARAAVLTAGAAVLAYKARHGAYPERLEQALPQPPLDPFSDQPVRYRREGEGFVVYSVGPHGDNEGRETAAGAEEQVRFRYPAPPPRRPPWLDAPAPAPTSSQRMQERGRQGEATYAGSGGRRSMARLQHRTSARPERRKRPGRGERSRAIEGRLSSPPLSGGEVGGSICWCRVRQGWSQA